MFSGDTENYEILHSAGSSIEPHYWWVSWPALRWSESCLHQDKAMLCQSRHDVKGEVKGAKQDAHNSITTDLLHTVPSPLGS